MRRIGAIILAGGKGTRMKSDRAKVLHEICGVSMIRYVVEAALSVLDDVVVVVGHQAAEVKEVLKTYPVRFALQEKQLGTGHAVLTALPGIREEIKTIAVLCGDTPLLKRSTLTTLIESHEAASQNVTILGTNLEEPYGYGRLICGDDNAEVVGIVEEADADELQKGIRLINSGTYCMDVEFLKTALPKLDRENAQQEFYLTDIVALANGMGQPALMVKAEDSLEVLGVNTREDLSIAEKVVTQAIKEGCENPLDFCRFH